MKVSIITIVYNNKDCIKDSIESVLSQCYKDVEYIIIDGGSSDGTKDVISSYVSSISNYTSEKDNGLYDALNKGISKATGDIIGILHSDDLFYDENSLLNVMEAFNDSKADLVYAKGIYVKRNDLSKVKRIFSSKSFKSRYLKWGWIPLHTTIYVRRELFQRYGLYNENYSIASDYDISLRWFKNKSIKKYFLNKFIVKMRLGGKSTTPKLQRKKSAEDLRIIRNHNLMGYFTLAFKISRKILQYIKPYFVRVLN